ncbi:MAG TPA: SDR family oxidoreductase [Prolixibacteraceae bacterium]|nr:SDR family oxidoreductase [Prolixibacteraceae bacterium]
MNKTALVTGAASGLGSEFSNLLANDSYDLILIDINENSLIETKQKIEKKYPVKVSILTYDLCKPKVADLIYQELKNKKIDVLINNAGFGLFGFFSETEWEIEESMILLHVLTLTHLTKLILKDMVLNGSGKILNVSSLAAFQPGPMMSVYYATKAYILSFSEALANEVKGTGVTVTVLCPGQTKTNFENIAAVNSKSKVSKIKMFTADAEAVARYGYNSMKEGKTTAIPGTVNKFTILISRHIPRKTTAFFIRKIQTRIRK